MNKTILCILLLALSMPFGYGQQGCYPPPSIDPFNAPIVECLDGYQWMTTPSAGNYFEPPAFCGDIDNPQWLAFVAQTDIATISLSLNNCVANNGLQLAVYGMYDPCSPFNLYPIQCFTTPNGTPEDPSVFVFGLEIGRVYYILIDGWRGDICEYTVDISPNLTYPNDTPQLSGPTSVVSGSPYTYTLNSALDNFIEHNPCDNPFEKCGCGVDTCQLPIQYIWTGPAGATIVPGTPPTQAEITFGDVGGQVCVEITSCTSVQYCLDVTVEIPGAPCDAGTDFMLSDSCISTPLFCGLQINGLCGNNAGMTADVPGNLSSVISCDITNNQYFRFVADKSEIELIISTNNCQLGNGLELSILATDDCENFQSVVDCVPLADGGNDTLNFSGLTPCSEYLFMLDGQSGDACDFQIFILGGINTEPFMINEISPGCIEGPTPICVGELATYTLTLPVCEITGGGNCGGGGYDFYNPNDSCQADSTYLQWHVPDGMRILSDSINVTEITVAVVDTPGGFIFVTNETVSSSNDSCGGGCYGIGGGFCTIKPLWVDIDIDNRDTTVVICEGECYSFCNTTYCPPPGTYTYECPIECGYEVLTLIVEPFEEYYEFAEICDGDCYDFFGLSICAGGTYTFPISNCEVYYLDVFTIPPINATVDVVDASCNGVSDGSILVNISGGRPPFICAIDGSNFTSNPFFGGLQAGSYVISILDANGCETQIIGAVSEPPAIALSANTTDVSCSGGSDGSLSVIATGGVTPYTYSLGTGGGGSTTNGLPAGGYELVVTDANGCTASINAFINEPAELEISATSQSTSCAGISDGSILADVDGGTPPYTYYFAGGNPSSSLSFNGLAPGIYPIEVRDDNNCQAITTIEVREGVALEENITQQICQGEEVNVGSNTYNATGVFTNTLTANSGCDSIVTLDLTVTPTLQEFVNQQICQGEEVSIGSNTYNSSGVFTNTLTASSGCDSIVTLDLTVTPILQEFVNQQICQGEEITVGNNTYNSTGVFTNTLTASSGCDSIVTLDLTVTPTLQEFVNQQICQGEEVTIGSNTYNSTGVFTNTLTASSGCDSIVTLDLTVTSTLQEFINQQICQGEEVTIGSNTYNSTGIFTNTLTASSGCDSIVTLDLTVTPILQEFVNQQICQGEEATIGSNTYNSTGIFTNTLTASSGCDSIVTLDLIVTPTLQEFVNQQICQGEEVTIGSNTYNSTGVFSNTLTASSGCDSIVTLDLTVTPILQEFVNQQICQGEEVSIGSNTYNSTGIFTNTLTANSGCDSIVTLDLTVTPTLQEFVNQQICQGEEVSIGNNTYNSTGIFTNTLTASSGCDSIVTLDLTVTPTLQEFVNQQICQGEEVTIGSNTYNSTGIFTNTLTASSGCDSIVTLDLTVTPILQEFVNQQICQGEEVTVGNNTYNSTGVFTNTLTASSGCDSIVTLDLTVTPTLQEFVNQQICQGEEVTIGNNTYNSTGIFTNTLTASSGCDSIVTLDLVVNPIDTFDQGIQQLCLGDCYSLLGITYCQAGTYAIPTIGNDNCTDVYQFEITYYSSPGPAIGAVVTECDITNDYYTVSFDVIDGIPPFLVNGQLIPGGYFFSSPIPVDSTYSFTLIDSDLCPVEILITGANECEENCLSDAGEMETTVLYACEQASINVLPPSNSTLDQDDVFEYILHTGNGTAIGDIIARNNNGLFSYLPGLMNYGETYYVSFVVGNLATNNEVDLGHSCTSVAPGQPIVFSPTPIAEAGQGGTLSCDQPEIELIAEGGALSGNMSYQWSTLDGNILTDATDLSIWVNQAGTYVLSVVEYYSGCLDIDTVIVSGNTQSPTISAGADQVVQLGDSLHIYPNSSITPTITRWWIDDLEISEADLNLHQLPLNTATYTVQIEDEYGCTAEDQVEVRVDRRSKIYFPNIFTPNNDNINDRFTIYADPSVNMVLSVQIFSRWGDLVFSQQNFPPNDPNYGWDGQHKNEILNNAVFVYKVEVELIDGSKKMYTGDITLVR